MFRLYFTKAHNTFRAHYLQEFFSQWFDIRPYDLNHEIGIEDTLLLSLPEYLNDVRFHDIPTKVLDTVGSIIVDNLQEPFLPDLTFLEPYRHKVLVLTTGHMHSSQELDVVIIPEWFWYFESLWYRSRDYHLYRPAPRSKSKLFFMPIRRRRLGRDVVYHKLRPMLHQSIHSYVELGVRLPGIPDQHSEDQRWLNPDWYDQTCFSVVCEDDDDSYPIMWSEKSCKPLAFFHPFVVVAQRGLLRLIQNHGFQTFPEIFDESYDDLPDIYQRARAVCKQIKYLSANDFQDPRIREKTQHNHDRFFHQHLIRQHMTERLIHPMLEFLESTT